MKLRKLVTGAAAAALAVSPVAAQAASSDIFAPVRVGAELLQANDQMEDGATIGIVFFLVVAAVAIFAASDNEPNVAPAPTSP